MIAAIYVRVSTEEQAEKGYSLAEQKRVCQERAEASGAAEVVVYADEGISGGILERPALSRLREAIRRRRVDILICRDPDRLSRNLTHQLIISSECEQYGVDLEFTGWEWKKTPEGQLFFAIRGAISQYEKEKIRERMKRGKTQKALSGLEPNRINIYGYQYDVSGQSLVEEREAAVVRDIFKWFTTEDLGISGIAARLNDMALPGPGCKQWYKQTVRYILANPTYAGRHLFNVWDGRGIGNNKYTTQKVKRALRPENEWIPIAFPPLLDENTFQCAQEKLSRSRRLWAGKPRNSYLLSGLLRCGDCGNSMVGMLDHYNRANRNVMYSCRRETSLKGFCVPRKYVKGEPIEATVWEHVIGWIYQPAIIFKYIRDLESGTASVEERIEVLTIQLQTVGKGRKNILEVLASGTTALDETTRAILKQLTERQGVISHQIMELQAERLRQVSVQELEGITACGRELGDYLVSFTTEERKAIIRAFVDEVALYGRGDGVALAISATIPSEGTLAKLVDKYS